MESIQGNAIDWNLLRFQYEVLGNSAEQLAEENPSTNLGLIHAAIKEQGWKAGSVDSLVPVLQATKEEDSLEAFTNAAKAHLIGASLVKQKALFPEFAKAEAVLLSKISQAAIQVDPNDERACMKLSHLVKSLQGLLNHNNFLAMQAGDDSEAGGGITVQILNQV